MMCAGPCESTRHITGAQYMAIPRSPPSVVPKESDVLVQCEISRVFPQKGPLEPWDGHGLSSLFNVGVEGCLTSKGGGRVDQRGSRCVLAIERACAKVQRTKSVRDLRLENEPIIPKRKL